MNKFALGAVSTAATLAVTRGVAYASATLASSHSAGRPAATAALAADAAIVAGGRS